MTQQIAEWSTEVSALLLRGYARIGGGARREQFIAVAVIKMVGPRRAFIEGLLKADGCELTRADWRSLSVELHARGIEAVSAIRHGRERTFRVADWLPA
jgi:hypothetical protein